MSSKKLISFSVTNKNGETFDGKSFCRRVLKSEMKNLKLFFSNSAYIEIEETGNLPVEWTPQNIIIFMDAFRKLKAKKVEDLVSFSIEIDGRTFKGKSFYRHILKSKIKNLEKY